MFHTERLAGIQQHHIQITAKPTMLEAVVQHNQLRRMPIDRRTSGDHAVGILHMGHSGQRIGQLDRFIVGPSSARPIAATDNRHPHTMRTKPAGKPLDQRCFPRPSQGEIAHANHRHVNGMN